MREDLRNAEGGYSVKVFMCAVQGGDDEVRVGRPES